MTERTGLDVLADHFRAEMGPPVNEKLALNSDPSDLTIDQIFDAIKFLRKEVAQLREEKAASAGIAETTAPVMTDAQRETFGEILAEIFAGYPGNEDLACHIQANFDAAVDGWVQGAFIPPRDRQGRS